jgi:hypothetical protein
LGQQFRLRLIESILCCRRILCQHDLNCSLINHLFSVDLIKLLLVGVIICNLLGFWAVAVPTLLDLILLIQLELSESGIARGMVDS